MWSLSKHLLVLILNTTYFILIERVALRRSNEHHSMENFEKNIISFRISKTRVSTKIGTNNVKTS